MNDEEDIVAYFLCVDKIVIIVKELGEELKELMIA